MMQNRRMQPGSMTVFFALLSTAFILFIFAVLEGIHYQGARAYTANVTDMGNFSVFGEFEKKLLTDYEIFGVDGSYGSGDFHIGRTEDHLHRYLQYNACPNEGVFSVFFTPWKVSLTDEEITEYALLTDRDGEAFYQQAVSYMKKTAVTGSLTRLMHFWQDAQNAQSSQDRASQEQTASDQNMNVLEQESTRIREEQEEENPEGTVPTAPVQNPLKALMRLRRMDLFDLLCPGRAISDNSYFWGEVPFERFRSSGNLIQKREHGGLMDDLIFREYLMDHFGCFSKEKAGTHLSYEIEYILNGSRSDRANLKAVIKKLLALREGCNYLSLSADMQKSTQAEALAALLIGWTGIPQLIEIMKQALLLGWAYGESLLDVRVLLAGGRVPVFKREGDWNISLEQLAFTGELIAGCASQNREGTDYRGYLRMLLNLQGTQQQRKRGLNLIELNLKKAPGLAAFRADHCLTAVKDKTSWTIYPLLGGGMRAFGGPSAQLSQVSVKGGFAY